jgi:hypothetical protein
MAYTAEQLRNARIFAQMTRGMDPRIRLALMMAGLVESNLRHIDYGDRSSQGILQQRPDMGWGPYIPGPRGVRQDVRDFLSRAVRNNQGFRGSAGELAQSVQRSAYPDRYQAQLSSAQLLLNRFRGMGGGTQLQPQPRQGRPAAGGTQLGPIRITPQNLNLQKPTDVLAGLARQPSYLEQDGRGIAYQTGVGIAPQQPSAMTVQGVTTGDLYAQLREINKRLLTA